MIKDRREMNPQIEVDLSVVTLYRDGGEPTAWRNT